MKPATNDKVVVKPTVVAAQYEGVALKSRAIAISLGIVFSYSILITSVECIALSPVYWNLSNPM